MAAITPTQYSYIAERINDSASLGSDMSSVVALLETALTDSEVPSTDKSRLRLQRSINDLEIIAENNFELIQPNMTKFLYELQSHVERNYGDINEFLDNNSIKVGTSFADISSLAGFEIDSSNVE